MLMKKNVSNEFSEGSPKQVSTGTVKRFIVVLNHIYFRGNSLVSSDTQRKKATLAKLHLFNY